MKILNLKILSFIFVTIFSVFCLFGCGGTWQVIESVRFNTDVYIAVKGQPVKEKDAILAMLSDLENTLTLSGENSCIQAFNSATKNQPITITDDCVDILTISQELYALTKGKFNIAVRPVSKLYKLSSDTFDKTPPTDFPNIELFTSIASPENVVLDNISKSITKTVDGTEIDLGGIAKGYAVDKVQAVLTNSGYTEGYINIGGSSLYVFYTSEDLSIRHPRKNGQFILTVDNDLIKNTSISTSGDYERYYEKDGVRYSHIIDGVSLIPANTNVISATVIGGSATFTDAITTALCCFIHTPTNNESSPLINFMKELLQTQQYKDLGFFVVFNNGTDKQILTNKKQGEDFTLLDNEYVIVNI